ncbi:MAG: hypothetical protein IIA33_04880 [Planctomycetes bacterium]|nr:hypothetical protein [Planctomycetota bacterium]
MLVTHSMRMTFGVSLLFLVAAFSAMWPGQARAECEVLPACTISFDAGCPNAGEMCGAFFDGGGGCEFANLPFCYSTGIFSYRVDDANSLTIELSNDLIELEVFFANVGAASGEMRFFNGCGEEVGTPLETNGNCLLFMPDSQSQVFGDGVRTIEVTATGGVVYIDTFTITLGQVPSPFDFDGDCAVGAFDLASLLGAWGPCPDPCEPGNPCDTCQADADGDCNVGAFDLAQLLGNWGPQ